MTNSVLTVKEAADLLHMHPTTLSQRARTGRVPAFRLGARWLFSERLLREFIESASLQNCTFERMKEKCLSTS